MEGDQTWGNKHTVQCTEDVLQNCMPKTYILLLTSVIPNKLKQKQQPTKMNKTRVPSFGELSIQ